MDEEYFYLPPRERVTPSDSFKYYIPESVIHETERFLKGYGSRNPPHEGFVYWAGLIFEGYIQILTVIAPKTESGPGRVQVTNESNSQVIRELNKMRLVRVAQVHSHPIEWTDHSPGDDKWASFRVEGLVSIVVPKYGKEGILPIAKCGVHRYNNGDFIRLSDEYVHERFQIIPSRVDLRT